MGTQSFLEAEILQQALPHQRMTPHDADIHIRGIADPLQACEHRCPLCGHSAVAWLVQTGWCLRCAEQILAALRIKEHTVLRIHLDGERALTGTSPEPAASVQAMATLAMEKAFTGPVPATQPA